MSDAKTEWSQADRRWPSIFELQRGADVGYAVATRVLDFLKGLSDANQ